MGNNFYLLVKFLKDKKAAVIHHTWLDKTQKICSWPPPSANLPLLLKKGTRPPTKGKLWKTYEIILLAHERFSSLTKADQTLDAKIAELEQKAIETDDDSHRITRVKTVQTVKSLPNPFPVSNSAEVSEERTDKDESGEILDVEKDGVEGDDEGEESENSETKSGEEDEVLSDSENLSSPEIEVTHENLTAKVDGSKREEIAEDSNAQENKPQDQNPYQQLQNDDLSEEISLDNSASKETTLKSIQSEIQSIKDMIENKIDNGFYDYKEIEDRVPLQTLDDLESMDKDAGLDAAYFEKVVKWMRSIGGSDEDALVSRILPRLITPDVGKHFSLTGFKFEKNAFNVLNMYRCLQTAVKRNIQDADEDLMEASIKKFLKHCPERATAPKSAAVAKKRKMSQQRLPFYAKTFKSKDVEVIAVKPAADKPPAAEKPATEKPATEESVKEKPAASTSGTNGPTISVKSVSSLT